MRQGRSELGGMKWGGSEMESSEKWSEGEGRS